MLRKTRIALAVVFWAAITLLLADCAGALGSWIAFTAKIQFLPAVLALNVAVVAGLILLTFVCGRVYCSVICPLGVFQDMVSWLRGKFKKKDKFRFSYSKPKNIVRYAVLCVFIALILAGLTSIAALIAPYSMFGKIVTSIFHTHTLVGASIAAVSFILITCLAWWDGRIWCNTICPVGSVLGLVSRFSLFGPVIDKSKCVECHLCGKACKASCIDSKERKIDASRCVACMDCISNCKHGAISYGFRYKKESAQAQAPKSEAADTSRRAFMATAGLIAGTAMLKAQEAQIGGDGGLAPIEPKKAPERLTPLVPAGAVSLKNLRQHCIGCQLCVNACPNKVLRPNMSLEGFLQPVMSYENGFCRPECTKCADVCPAGAIQKVTREEKTAIQIGLASVDLWMCVANTEGVKCGNCARHCPAGAIKLTHVDPEDKESAMIPSVNEERCIGCGACEYVCPVRPLSAIRVEGYEVHHIK